MPQHYIGLMSGTSLDGVDGVLADFSGSSPRVLATASEPFPQALRAELLALNAPTDNELHRAARAAQALTRLYARVVDALVHKAGALGVAREQIRAIGVHGQTVRHQPAMPGEPPGSGYTLQLNNPALLAELTGLDVVADFRSRDMAAGGQGAPLVPAFHQRIFGRADGMVTVLNLGGIANLSVLPAPTEASAHAGVLGFDCGPGNALMDAWCQQHTGQPFDTGGAWAAGGQVIPGLLSQLLEDAYFSRPPPKSTGRDLFSMAWLAGKLAAFAAEQPQDVQATLTELTARSCTEAVLRHAPASQALIVCGGGAFNLYLLQRLRAGLPAMQVHPSDQHGLPPLQVEAAAFAWLARQSVLRLPGNLPAATGAAGPRILGAIYPA